MEEYSFALYRFLFFFLLAVRTGYVCHTLLDILQMNLRIRRPWTDISRLVEKSRWRTNDPCSLSFS
jgi:hypothetical protein